MRRIELSGTVEFHHCQPGSLNENRFQMTDMVTRKPSTNQVQEIVRALEEQIVLGWLMPRQRLLEEKLSAHFACKKHVIREAIFELERMGLVEHIANKGATVRLLSPEEIGQIYS